MPPKKQLSKTKKKKLLEYKTTVKSLEDDFRHDLGVHLYSACLYHLIDPLYPQANWVRWPLAASVVPDPKTCKQYVDPIPIEYESDITPEQVQMYRDTMKATKKRKAVEMESNIKGGRNLRLLRDNDEESVSEISEEVGFEDTEDDSDADEFLLLYSKRPKKSKVLKGVHKEVEEEAHKEVHKEKGEKIGDLIGSDSSDEDNFQVWPSEDSSEDSDIEEDKDDLKSIMNSDENDEESENDNDKENGEESNEENQTNEVDSSSESDQEEGDQEEGDDQEEEGEERIGMKQGIFTKLSILNILEERTDPKANLMMEMKAQIHKVIRTKVKGARILNGEGPRADMYEETISRMAEQMCYKIDELFIELAQRNRNTTPGSMTWQDILLAELSVPKGVYYVRDPKQFYEQSEKLFLKPQFNYEYDPFMVDDEGPFDFETFLEYIDQKVPWKSSTNIVNSLRKKKQSVEFKKKMFDELIALKLEFEKVSWNKGYIRRGKKGIGHRMGSAGIPSDLDELKEYAIKYKGTKIDEHEYTLNF